MAATMSRTLSSSTSSTTGTPPSDDPPTYAADEFIFEHDLFSVSLGRRKWPTPLPAYGVRAPIRGHVLCKRDPGDPLIVSLLGELTLPTSRRSRVFLRQSLALPDHPSGMHTFALRFPSLADLGNAPLPPSTSRPQEGGCLSVRYLVRVERPRQQRAALDMPVLYLPRSLVPVPDVLTLKTLPFTAPPPPTYGATEQAPHADPPDVSGPAWARTRAPVETAPPTYSRLRALLSRAAASASASASTSAQSSQDQSCPDEPLEILLPHPPVFAASNPIPFVLRFASPPAYPPTIHLVARLTHRTKTGFTTRARESVLARAEIWGSAARGCILWGVVHAPRAEVSWCVRGVVQLEHGIRVGGVCAPVVLRSHAWDAVDRDSGRKVPALTLWLGR